MLPLIFLSLFYFMISIKNLIIDYKDIPETWIFEHYCKLNRKLVGQDEKIKSMFNSKDTVPSMCIYFNKSNGKYRFKDFSTGKSGDAINLVIYIYELSFKDAVNKVINDYKKYINHHKEYTISEFREYAKFKVCLHSVREWNILDRDFWVRYNVGTSLLNKYNIKPLESYTMEKGCDDENIEIQSITISDDYIYGYFKENGELYKIYQPKNKNKKFLKIKSYIQGSEQLENHHNLLITSSLKDILSIKSLGLKIDCIAPDSENTMIPKAEMLKYLELYHGNVSVSFDNDDPGIEAMKKYKNIYNINAFVLPLSKDPSDSIKEHGVKKVLYTLVPLLQRSYERVSL